MTVHHPHCTTTKMKLSEVESLISNEGRELLCRLLQYYVDEHGLCDVGDFVRNGHEIISLFEPK